MEEKNKKIVLAIILIVIFTATISFLAYLITGKKNQIAKNKNEISHSNDNFMSNRSEVAKLIHEDNNYLAAINKIESLLKEKQFNNLDQEANLKIILAEAYSYNSKDDFKKGVDILKEVATNSNYSNRYRSTALSRMAFFAGAYERSFIKENIFNEGQYLDMMREGLVGLAQARLYSMSISLGGFPTAYYKIADWYLSQALDNKRMTISEKNDAMKTAKQEFEKGEDLFNLYNLKNPSDLDQLVVMYRIYSRVAAKLYLLQEFDDSQKIIDSYDKAIAIYEKLYNIQKWPVNREKVESPVLRSQLLPLIYDYASFLAVTNKFDNQGKIGELMQVLYDKSWDQGDFYNFFDFLNDQKMPVFENGYNRFMLLSLAKADSNFANLLIEKGWTKGELSETPVLPVIIKK